MPTAAATRPAAATARSSAGTTRSPMSSCARTSATPSSIRRGRSTTTVPPLRRAAASTARTACGGTATQSPRSQLSTRSECNWGSDSSSAPPPTRPRDAANAGHLSPSAVSPPSRTSRPPPRGSASTRRLRNPSRAEVTASAQASVDAPAPPRPPMTPTVRAGRPTPSATSAMRSTSHCSPSGSIRTWSAPISTARCQIPESS